MAMSRNRERTNSRAVIYSRLSPRIRPDGSESCEKQIEICQRYCDFCKLEVIGVFYDKNKSGVKAANRPGLQLALHKTIKNQAILVVHSLSRLAWNTKETIKIIERLEHAKADLCSFSEKIDTTKDYSQYFYKTVALFVKLERELVSERTSDAMLRHQRAGRRINGIPEPNRVYLYILRHPIEGDMAITASDISFGVTNLLQGTFVDINAVIHNLGDVAEVNVPIAFFHGNPDSNGVLIDDIITVVGPIAAGDIAIATISWFIPAVNGPQQIYVVIDPNFVIEDANRSNNIASVSTIAPDFAVASISSERIGPKNRGITARIRNSGGLPAENVGVVIRRGSADGPELASFNITQLNSDSLYDIWYVWNIAAEDFNSVEIPLYIIADEPDSISESDEDNNLSFNLVQVGKVADATDNGQIDFADFAKFANNWLDSCVAPEWCEACDFNQNQEVDFNDLAKICESWLWQASWYNY